MTVNLRHQQILDLFPPAHQTAIEDYLRLLGLYARWTKGAGDILQEAMTIDLPEAIAPLQQLPAPINTAPTTVLEYVRAKRKDYYIPDTLRKVLETAPSLEDVRRMFKMAIQGNVVTLRDEDRPDREEVDPEIRTIELFARKARKQYNLSDEQYKALRAAHTHLQGKQILDRMLRDALAQTRTLPVLEDRRGPGRPRHKGHVQHRTAHYPRAVAGTIRKGETQLEYARRLRKNNIMAPGVFDKIAAARSMFEAKGIFDRGRASGDIKPYYQAGRGGKMKYDANNHNKVMNLAVTRPEERAAIDAYLATVKTQFTAAQEDIWTTIEQQSPTIYAAKRAVGRQRNLNNLIPVKALNA